MSGRKNKRRGVSEARPNEAMMGFLKQPRIDYFMAGANVAFAIVWALIGSSMFILSVALACFCWKIGAWKEHKAGEKHEL